MLTKREKIFHFVDNYLLLMPIIFAIAVIPLIVRITYYDPGLSQYAWFSNETEFMDMFLYYKNQAMMVLDGALLIGYIYLLVRRKLVTARSFLPLFVYLFLAVISTVFSVAPEQSWNGFYGMLESAYAVFGYCLICYFAFTVIRTEKQLKWVMVALAFSTLMMGAIGLSQFLGVDFYASDLGKDLIFPAEYAEHKDGLTMRFGVGTVYASLFNPNYVGVYSSLLVPVLFVLLFTVKGKLQAAACTVLLALVLVCLVGSGSQSAILALTPCLLFAVIYFGIEGQSVVYAMLWHFL